MAGDEPSPRDTVEWLSAFGRSRSRDGGHYAAEHELLRLAGDPLLLHQFLLRGEEARPGPRVPLPAEVTVALGHHPQDDTSESSVERSFLRRLEGREPRNTPSLVPDAFTPSAEDRDEALDHESGDRPPPSVLRPDWTAGDIVLLLAGCTFLLLSLVLFLFG